MAVNLLQFLFDCLNNRWGESDRQSSRSAVVIDAGGDFPFGGIQIYDIDDHFSSFLFR